MDRMMKALIVIYIALVIYGITVIVKHFGLQSF